MTPTSTEAPVNKTEFLSKADKEINEFPSLPSNSPSDTGNSRYETTETVEQRFAKVRRAVQSGFPKMKI